MLSIIICSRDRQLLQQVSKNIDDTIGISYEIIAIDNSNGDYGICKAYNIGASRAKYSFLCFMHEDIRIYTQGWGQLVVSKLEAKETGVIGIAGGRIKTCNPETWYLPIHQSIRMSIIENTTTEKVKYSLYNPNNEETSEVITLDGVWMCCRKKVWDENRFDEDTFRHFHFYDLDFCLQLYRKKLKVKVIYDILIEHYSTGNLNRIWIKDAILYWQKWNNYLPISIDFVSKEDMDGLSYISNKYFLEIMLQNNYRGSYLLKSFVKYYLRKITRSAKYRLKKLMN